MWHTGPTVNFVSVKVKKKKVPQHNPGVSDSAHSVSGGVRFNQLWMTEVNRPDSK